MMRLGTPIRACLLFLFAVCLTAHADEVPTAAVAKSAVDASKTSAQVLKITAAIERYQDTPVGFTTEGYAFRGNPDADVTMTEYTDYACPYCAAYFRDTQHALFERYGRAGKVKFVIQDLPLESLHPTARLASVAVACVGEQGAVKYW